MFNVFRPNVGKLKEKRDVKGLLNALKNKDVNIRCKAVQALGEIGDLGAVEPLAKAIQDESGLVGFEAVKVLGKMGEPAFEPLVQALKHEDLNIRREAARILGERRDVRTVEPLTRALSDRDSSIRYIAIKALGEIGDAKAVKSLIQLPLSYDREREDERKSAIEALVKIGRNAVELLIQDGLVMKDYYLAAGEEKEYWRQFQGKARIREGASECLGKIMDPRAIEPLIQVLDDRVGSVRLEAAKALKEIGEPAVRLLIPAIKFEYGEYRRELAARTLGEIRDTRAVEPLIQSLQDKNEKVRIAAIEALLKIRDTRAVEPLTKTLKEKSPIVQQTAAHALVKMGELIAAEAVIDWLFESENAYNKVRYDYDHEFFGDYSDYVLKASSSYINEEYIVINPDSEYFKYRYELQGSDDAIHKLCNIQTQISSNILYKVTQKKDVQVVWAQSTNENLTISKTFTTLSFGSQRDMAKKELERRGNPPYDPSAYLKRDAWKIPL